MINDIAFYFVCAFAAYGVISMGFDLWGMWLRRGRTDKDDGLLLIDHAPVNFADTVAKRDPDEEFADLCEKLCATDFFGFPVMPNEVNYVDVPRGDSVESTAAPEGSPLFDDIDWGSEKFMRESHARYLAGDPDGVPYLDPDDDEPCDWHEDDVQCEVCVDEDDNCTGNCGDWECDK